MTCFEKLFKFINVDMRMSHIYQTVMHCHMHLIPRRNGDTESPEGGVRGVISSKQKYRGV